MISHVTTGLGIPLTGHNIRIPDRARIEMELPIVDVSFVKPVRVDSTSSLLDMMGFCPARI